ncbi:hypothetical protein [Caballeronia sp. AZ1_KS37]|uniref:hypothetical protein n=1 Tax=Caballeronia sp. AZ1_KS37 TaxID=2921756 RepID=UPI0020281614|nr:hypothetical protein [Caballeronia sp. AZ1_KS37]
MRKSLVLLCLLPSMAFASDWVVVHEAVERSVDRGPMTVSVIVDRDSIATIGQTKQVWWKQVDSAKGFWMEWRNHTAFDCQRHTLRQLRVATRKEPSASYTWAEVGGQTFDVEPDDVFEFAFSAVCLNMWKQN